MVNNMRIIFYFFIASSALASCSGPSYFNSPADYMGGNRAAAVATHCARQAGEGKETLVYKLCEQSYTTHYGE